MINELGAAVGTNGKVIRTRVNEDTLFVRDILLARTLANVTISVITPTANEEFELFGISLLLDTT